MLSRKVWRSLLILTLVGGILVLLMTIELLPKPDNTYFWRAFFDGGHAPLFGTMALIFLGLCRLTKFTARRPVRTQYLIAGGAAMLSGIIVELSQIGTARDADPLDVARNTAGIIACLLIAATVDDRLRTPDRCSFRRRWWLRTLALVIFAIPFIPAMQWGAATIDRNLRFPLLAGFESSFDQMPVSVNAGDARRVPRPADFRDAQGEMVETVLLRPTTQPLENRYPTLQIEEPYPDWQGFDSLTFAICLRDSLPRTLWLRIHDRRHTSHPADRFNRQLTLHPGSQHIAISLPDIRLAPTTREMNMARIRSLRFFIEPGDPELNFLLDDIRLK